MKVMKNVNKKRLSRIYQEISRKTITLSKAEKDIELFLTVLEEALLKDKKVKFAGKGIFEIVERKPRIVSNPVTRELMKIYPLKIVKFKMSKKLTME